MWRLCRGWLGGILLPPPAGPAQLKTFGDTASSFKIPRRISTFLLIMETWASGLVLLAGFICKLVMNGCWVLWLGHRWIKGFLQKLFWNGLARNIYAIQSFYQDGFSCHRIHTAEIQGQTIRIGNNLGGESTFQWLEDSKLAPLVEKQRVINIPLNRWKLVVIVMY